MKRIKEPMHRYGEADFDRNYLKWGLHDPKTQEKEARSVLNLLPKEPALNMLDLACGIGVHGLYWARQGHDVTAVDISETFIAEGKKAAARDGLAATFVVSDIEQLDYTDCFDVVTWIERSYIDQSIVEKIYGFLRQGGVFIADMRNPEHLKTQRVNADFRTWREEDGRFLLESHETDDSGIHHDVWIEIDPTSQEIIERFGSGLNISFADSLEMLKKAGFSSVDLYTISGEPFTGGPEPYWLWALTRK